MLAKSENIAMDIDPGFNPPPEGILITDEQIYTLGSVELAAVSSFIVQRWKILCKLVVDEIAEQNDGRSQWAQHLAWVDKTPYLPCPATALSPVGGGWRILSSDYAARKALRTLTERGYFKCCESAFGFMPGTCIKTRAYQPVVQLLTLVRDSEDMGFSYLKAKTFAGM